MTWPNKLTGANSRRASPLDAGRQFGRPACAPPFLSAAVAQFWRRRERGTQGQAFAGFAWQAGYGAFSVSESNVPSVREYIAGQREHHRKKSFQDEYLAFLERHRVAFDERYVWD
jgi:hypothetical protein